jgi:hypothetical protein
MENIIMCLISFAIGVAFALVVLRREIFQIYQLNKIEVEMVRSLLKSESEEERVDGINPELMDAYLIHSGTLGGVGSGVAWPKVGCECSGEHKASK